MTVLKRLQMVRNELQKKELKQSGKNGFSNYSYFQISDFINYVTTLSNEHGITPILTFSKEVATLTIYNSDDKEDFIVFETPFILAEMKSAINIQKLGSSITYIKRYLYMLAFEISDADGIDCLDAKNEIPEPKTDNEKEDKIAIIKMRAKNNKELIIEAMKNAKVSKLEDLSASVLDELVKALK